LRRSWPSSRREGWRRFLEVALEGSGVTDEELADLPRVNAILVPISIPEGLSEDEVAAFAHLVEEVVAAPGLFRLALPAEDVGSLLRVLSQDR
jgi:hypothetical protein